MHTQGAFRLYPTALPFTILQQHVPAVAAVLSPESRTEAAHSPAVQGTQQRTSAKQQKREAKRAKREAASGASRYVRAELNPSVCLEQNAVWYHSNPRAQQASLLLTH